MNKNSIFLLLGVFITFTIFNVCKTVDGNIGKKYISEDSINFRTITIWSTATESNVFSKSYENSIKDFENSNPGIKINHSTFDTTSYKQSIKIAAAVNNLPDLFYTWAGRFSQPFIDSEKVLELNDYFTEEYKSQLPKTALTYTTYNGKIYGAPYITPVSALFYNKKIFETNNLKPPKTIIELISVCEKLKEKNIIPIALSAKDSWVLAIIHDALVLKIAGPDKIKSILIENKYSYDNPEFLAAAHIFKDLVYIGAFQDDTTKTTNNEAQKIFLEEKAAMYVMGSWFTSEIQKDKLNAFDVVPFPIEGQNAKSTDFIGGPIDNIMVSKSSKNNDIAGKAVFELTKNISKYSYLDGTGLTVWKVDYDDSRVSTINKKLTSYVSNATSFTLWFDLAMESNKADKYLNLLQELFIGNITPKEFISSMDEILNN